MDIIDNFSIINNKICLNSYKLVIRHYKDIDKKEFVDKDYYVNDDRLIELETQIIPKHQLLELISKVKLDNEQYSYMRRLCHKHRMNLILIWTTECLRWN